MPAHQRHVVERGQEPAPARNRRFGHVRGAGAVFATGGKALQQARQQQNDRRSNADRRHGGRDRNDERAQRHHRYRNGQRQPATVAVGKAAEIPRPDRAHQERHRKDRPHEHRGVLVFLGKELRLEIDRKHRVDVDVVPLDQIAGRALERVGHRAAKATGSCARTGGDRRRWGCAHAVRTSWMGQPQSIGARLCDACKHFGAYTDSPQIRLPRASFSPLWALAPQAIHGTSPTGRNSTHAACRRRACRRQWQYA